MQKLSRTDRDSRILPDRRGFMLRYTATPAVSDDQSRIERQRVAGADGGPGAACVRQAAGTSECGQRRLLRRADERCTDGEAVVEPVFGVLKEQRGMRRFRMRGLRKVGAEFALATTALNLTPMWRLQPARPRLRVAESQDLP